MRTRYRLAHAAFQDVAHAELPPDLPHVHGAALVGEARIAGDDEQPADLRERGDDVLDHAVGEVVLLRIAAHVRERKDGDRRAGRQGPGLACTVPVLPPSRPPPAPRRQSGSPCVAGCGSSAVLRHCRRSRAGGVDSAGQRRIGDDAPLPDGGEHVVAADHSLPRLNEKLQQVEDLPLDRHKLWPRRNSRRLVSITQSLKR